MKPIDSNDDTTPESSDVGGSTGKPESKTSGTAEATNERGRTGSIPYGRLLVGAAVALVVVAAAGPTVAATVGDAVTSVTGPDDGDADIGVGGDVSIAPDHLDALREAGSATTDLELRRDAGSRTVTVSRSTRADFESGNVVSDNRARLELYHGFIDTEPLWIQQYETPDGTYTRTGSSLVSGNYTRYDEADGNWTDEEFADHAYEDVVEGAEELAWERDGREEYEGSDVVRYTVDAPDDVEGLELELSLNASAAPVDSSESVSLTLSNVTVTDASGTLLVDTSGAVRHLEYRFEVLEDGDSVTYVANLDFDDIGSTDVEIPDWASDVEK